jgi:hypothetical protein
MKTKFDYYREVVGKLVMAYIADGLNGRLPDQRDFLNEKLKKNRRGSLENDFRSMLGVCELGLESMEIDDEDSKQEISPPGLVEEYLNNPHDSTHEQLSSHR